MIDQPTFRRLRLADFLDADHIEHVKNWEYLDRYWSCDRFGFTEWLQPESNPNELGALSIDLVSLDPDVVSAMLTRLELPVATGMTVEQLGAALGPVVRRRQFVKGRTTYEWRLNDPSYDVSVTVLDDEGAAHVSVVAR